VIKVRSQEAAGRRPPAGALTVSPPCAVSQRRVRPRRRGRGRRRGPGRWQGRGRGRAGEADGAVAVEVLANGRSEIYRAEKPNSQKWRNEVVLVTYCSQAITLSDVSPCGRAGGYATTRKNCGPDMCCRGSPPPGEPNGEPTSPIRRAGLNGPRSGTGEQGSYTGLAAATPCLQLLLLDRGADRT
jgi:hypothetical protein